MTKLTSIAPNIRERVRPGMHAVIFTVEGSAGFPFDMLRYDACFPLTEAEDAWAIAIREYGATRRVVLAARPVMGEKWVSLTPARWRSFGWRFIGIGELRDEKRYPTMPEQLDGEFFHRAAD